MRMIYAVFFLLLSFVKLGCDREEFLRVPAYYPTYSETSRDAMVATLPPVAYVDAGVAPADAHVERRTVQITPPPPRPKRAKSSGGRTTESKPRVEDKTADKPRGRANGVACTWDSECASGSCTYRVCASRSGDKKLGNGVACTWDSECASDSCTYRKCTSRGDSKELGNGVACTWDSECASDSCVYHVCQDAKD
jgi:hypothetical protein